MKKYRYQDLSSRTPWQKYRPYVLLFFSWNLIAFTLWSYVSRKAEERHPDFNSLTDAEKILVVTGSDLKNVKKTTFHLFGSDDKNDS